MPGAFLSLFFHISAGCLFLLPRHPTCCPSDPPSPSWPWRCPGLRSLRQHAISTGPPGPGLGSLWFLRMPGDMEQESCSTITLGGLQLLPVLTLGVSNSRACKGQRSQPGHWLTFWWSSSVPSSRRAKGEFDYIMVRTLSWSLLTIRWWEARYTGLVKISERASKKFWLQGKYSQVMGSMWLEHLNYDS